jgi:hypothetical protein
MICSATRFDLPARRSASRLPGQHSSGLVFAYVDFHGAVEPSLRRRIGARAALEDASRIP